MSVVAQWWNVEAINIGRSASYCASAQWYSARCSSSSSSSSDGGGSGGGAV